jgi:hypothetical protein
MSARCNNWFSPGAFCVCHLLSHFIFRLDALASIASSIESSKDQADRLTRRLDRR